jgi:hypothetical protein
MAELNAVKANIEAMSTQAPGTLDLNKLQSLFIKAGRLTQQQIEDEEIRKEIQAKLNAIRKNYEELHSILSTLKPDAGSNRNHGANHISLSKTKKHNVRVRVNPELRALGIEPPVGQRPGNERVPLGTKIKKDRRRKTRKNK